VGYAVRDDQFLVIECLCFVIPTTLSESNSLYMMASTKDTLCARAQARMQYPTLSLPHATITAVPLSLEIHTLIYLLAVRP